MKKIFGKIVHILLIFLITIMFVASLYLKIIFPSVNFEEVIFYLRNGVHDIDYGVFWQSLLLCMPFIILVFGVIWAVFYGISIRKKEQRDPKKRKIFPIKIFSIHKKKMTGLLFVITFIFLMFSFNLPNYIIYTNSESSFIEDHYIDPKNTEITFNEKRNLIIIYVESLETTLFTKKQGGYWNYDVVPELYEILNDEDTTVFYDKDLSQLLNMIQGSSWTTASLVANSTAVPFKIRINKNGYYSKNFLNGTYNLGDLLSDNGYYNEVISGARTSFGGLKEFYQKHGDYAIVDIETLKNYGFILKEDDKGKWGFNDNYLFEIAKERLNEISQKDVPFNFNLITIDTHFIDGYVGNYSETKYKDQYENAYATTSRLIYDFIEWVKDQPYYNNTTIVLVGDHLSMQNSFFRKHGAKESDRYVYSCIINPINNIGKQKGRIITALDTYPTIVSAIGGNIKGNKLGLGVNLFSDEKTLAEEYGVEFLDKELKKKSVFYNSNILNDNYINVY